MVAQFGAMTFPERRLWPVVVTSYCRRGKQNLGVEAAAVSLGPDQAPSHDQRLMQTLARLHEAFIGLEGLRCRALASLTLRDWTEYAYQLAAIQALLKGTLAAPTSFASFARDVANVDQVEAALDEQAAGAGVTKQKN